jgi:hypothetical protein
MKNSKMWTWTKSEKFWVSFFVVGTIIVIGLAVRMPL